MQISHKNWLPGYLSNWHMAMEVKARAQRKSSAGLQFPPQPLQSLMRHEQGLCWMLDLFDERLTRFERSLTDNNGDYDYGAYSEAVCFLDAVYFFSRMLLDSVAGLVRHRDLDKSEKGHQLPKSFDDMCRRSLRGELPNGLNNVFLECKTWFPQLKDRRDAVVHDYETYLIGFEQDPEGDFRLIQFSTREKANPVDEKDLRSYLGIMMAGYEHFVDGLLDYWDEMFLSWYNVSVLRHSTHFIGRSANVLWWAYRHGGYRNDNMVVAE